MENEHMIRFSRSDRSIAAASGTSSMPAHARGFSLAEMLVTLAVIMITTAIVGPAVKNSYETYKFRGAVTSTTGAIRSARYQAMAQGYSLRMVFGHTAGTYQLQRSADTDPSGTGAFTSLGNTRLMSGSSLNPGLGADITLQFIPSGAVKLVSGSPATMSSCGAAVSPPPCTLTLTYRGNTETISVTGYGTITVSP
ncbi:MAG: hypothetical protein DMG65_12530 [Candidatus Angelobacter sp. Gp1-AA117]|nr:MAG: hypothetical protein DMG65_12530 [Candidatus Angelobacter sp. Gp1-AA117]